MLVKTDDIPAIERVSDGGYSVKFVETGKELDDVLKLRFEVFNLELGEGLEESFKTGKDEDRFDHICHHLMVTDDKTGKIVGTYRMLTWEMIEDCEEFYSASEFELSHLSKEIYQNAVELGRACVSKQHRNLRVLYLLWKGLALYVWWKKKRYLFGCASLTSQDPVAGKEAMCFIQRQGYLHSGVFVTPKKGFECYKEEMIPGMVKHFDLPQLFKVYLTFGAKVCSAPAIDRLFKTIDFLMLFDLEDLDERNYNFFFDFTKD